MQRRILPFNLALGLLLAVLPSQAQDLSSLQGVTEKRPSFTVTRIGHGRPNDPAFLFSTMDAFLKGARP